MRFLKNIILYLKNFLSFIFSPSPKWRDIENYEGIYQISDFGDIYNVKDMKKVSTFFKKDGYECVALTDENGKTKQHRVHRLVASTFLANANSKKSVKHIDGDKKNNNVKNLKWT